MNICTTDYHSFFINRIRILCIIKLYTRRDMAMACTQRHLFPTTKLHYSTSGQFGNHFMVYSNARLKKSQTYWAESPLCKGQRWRQIGQHPIYSILKNMAYSFTKALMGNRFRQHQNCISVKHFT